MGTAGGYGPSGLQGWSPRGRSAPRRHCWSITTITDSAFTDGYWTSEDGLRLHYRDYPAAHGSTDSSGKGASRPPIICLHGLTRNARDFANLAGDLSDEGWRVIVPDMRGRGQSDYSRDPQTYHVGQYVADLAALRRDLAINRYVAIGTSMGGLMTMVQAMRDPDPLAACVLNDIGPVVEPGGLAHIKEYVGQGGSYPTWMHAARALEELHGASHPLYGLDDWLGMAKRNMVLCGNWRIAFDYDMKIAELLRAAGGDEAAVPPDLWPGLEALGRRPLLMIRGALSNLLTAETFAAMRARAPDALQLTVPDTGHAPTLDEPEARAAIGTLLAQVG